MTYREKYDQVEGMSTHRIMQEMARIAFESYQAGVHDVLVMEAKPHNVGEVPPRLKGFIGSSFLFWRDTVARLWQKENGLI